MIKERASKKTCITYPFALAVIGTSCREQEHEHSEDPICAAPPWSSGTKTTTHAGIKLNCCVVRLVYILHNKLIFKEYICSLYIRYTTYVYGRHTWAIMEDSCCWQRRLPVSNKYSSHGARRNMWCVLECVFWSCTLPFVTISHPGTWILPGLCHSSQRQSSCPGLFPSDTVICFPD